MSHDNKTESPTPRRRQKAREKGQVTRSRDLMSGVGTAVAIGVMGAMGGSFAAQWRAMLKGGLEAACHNDWRLGLASPQWFHLPLFAGIGLAAALAWFATTVAAVAQGGLVFAPAALAPKLARLSPASKLQQLFSVAAAARLLKSLLPGVAIVYIAIGILSRDWNAIRNSSSSGAALQFFLLARIFEMAWKSALVMLVWAVVDYAMERRRVENDLRMSKQELRDEFKETEGNPAVKQRIRRLQRQVRRRRMLEDVKRASVVITNPSEFAVALEYRPGMAAPVVVAKGRHHLAQQIKQVARWQGIPMVENPPLAHALYRAIEVGQAVPAKLYAAVAEVLAAVYRAQRRAAQAGS